MAVTVQVASETIVWNRGAEGDILRAVRIAQERGRRVCVRVDFPDLPLTIQTPCCPALGGGGQLNPRQQAVADAWRRHGLDAPGCDFPPGHLIAFLKEVTP